MGFAVDGEIVGMFLDETADGLAVWDSLCLKLDQNPEIKDLQNLFRIAHNIKGSSKSVGLDEMGSFVHHVEDVLVQLKDGKTKWSSSISKLMLEFHSIMCHWIEKLRSHPDYVPNLKSIEAHFGIHPEDAPATPSVSTFQEPSIHFDDKPEEKATRAGSETVRISGKKLDQLFDLVGEMSINRSILIQSHKNKDYSASSFDSAMERLETVSRHLQEAALGLRMQPLTSVYQRLNRICLDTANAVQKKVKLETFGGDTELDRSVVEKLLDPLVHLLRNCIDHGLETPEQRIKLGKPSFGLVKIDAVSSGSQVTITLTDDGRGLNLEKIRAKAISQNLISESDVLKKEQIQNLILLPGFSTQDNVSMISGRGVGMDVVKTTLESLGGSLRMDSEPNKGTRFQIQIPTQMGIIEGFVVSLDGARYAVPVSEVAQILDLNTSTVNQDKLLGATVFSAGQWIALEALSHFLKCVPHPSLESEGIPPPEPKTKSHWHRVALLSAVSVNRVAFEIDGLLGKQNVVVRPLCEKMKNYKGVVGTTILADGIPALIISLSAFTKRSETTQVRQSA